MQLNELSYLQTIAQQHSISAAAAKLNLSQQRLSRIVQNIENELGFKIFTRSKKGVSLTKDGVQFMKYLQNILTAYEDMAAYQAKANPKQAFDLRHRQAYQPVFTERNLTGFRLISPIHLFICAV